jgi:acetyltransferase EpsM
MEDPIKITIPLVNANEPEARLAGLHVQEGQKVEEGEAICTLETTKSIVELEAEASGYISGLRYRAGDLVHAGDILAYLVASSEDVAQPGQTGEQGPSQGDLPAGLRISRPALDLAQQHGLDLKRLPVGPMITEGMIKGLLDSDSQSAYSPLEAPFDPHAILIYGCGGHGKKVLALLRALGDYQAAGFVDDGTPQGQQIMGLPVLGGEQTLATLRDGGVRLVANGIGGIGDISVRVKIFQRLAQAGFACPTLVHPQAYVEPSADLSPGVQVFPGAYVGPEAVVGYGAIINTGVIVSHDCRLGSYVNLSPGAVLAGEVQVGDGALIGMGATINLQVKIGAGARIGNGATIKRDVPKKTVVRAGTIWPA